MSAKIIFGTWCAMSLGVSARKAPWEAKTEGPKYTAYEDNTRASQWTSPTLTYANEMPPAVGGQIQWIPPSWGDANYATLGLPQPAPAFALPQPAPTYVQYQQAMPYQQPVYAAPMYAAPSAFGALPSVPMPAPTVSYQNYMPY